MSTSVNQCKQLMKDGLWRKASHAFFWAFFMYPPGLKLHRKFKALYESLTEEERTKLGIGEDEEIRNTHEEEI